MHIILVLLALWWLIHFLNDLFGGTPGRTKWNVSKAPLQRQDWKPEPRDDLNAALSHAEKAGMFKLALIVAVIGGVVLMGMAMGLWTTAP